MLLLSVVLLALGVLYSLLFKPSAPALTILLVLASTVICVCGVYYWQNPCTLTLPGWMALGWINIDLRCDKLSSFFLILLGIVSGCAALFTNSYISHLDARINLKVFWCNFCLFILGMLLVIVAANAVTFLVAWEIMSLSSFILVGSEYEKHQAQRSAFIYLVATRVATMFLAAGFLLMYTRSHELTFASWTFAPHTFLFPAILIVTGLSIKAGIWPFHIWLPYAHTEAPAPVSALMSGVMVKIPVYAFLRLFVVGNLTCEWLAYVLLAVSAVSAFWGVLFALNQRELKRLLAYSTVENVSLIFAGLALILLGQNAHLTSIVQIGLMAVLLHCAFHALFKSLLFMCSGAVDYSAHTREFSNLGGLGKRMPITFLTFVIGCGAICALPPLNGFASKWCLYQALLQGAFGFNDVFSRSLCLALIGLLAGIGALAVASFAKAVGVTFLGKPRSSQAAAAKEISLQMQIPLLVLASACVITGAAAPEIAGALSTVLMPETGKIPAEVFKSIPLGTIGFILTITVTVIYLTILRRKPTSFETWDCGFGSAPIRSQVSADSFAQPIARIFSPVLQYSLSVDISGQDRKHFPEKIIVEPSMVSLLETKIYRPCVWLIQLLSRSVSKLQAGSIHLYLAYVCLALAFLLILGAQL